MSLMTILIIVLVIALLGGLAPWGNYPGPGHFYGTGVYGGGGLGLIVIILIVLLVLGRI